MNTRHWLILLATAGLFGSSFFFVKLATAGLPPMTIAAGRSVIAGIAILLVLVISQQRLPKLGADWWPLLVLGILTAVIPYIGIAWGQGRIDSSLGGILFATIPLFSVLAAPIILQEEKLTLSRIAGAVLGLAGVALVIGPTALHSLSGQSLGALATLTAAFSYAFGGIYARTQGRISPFAMAAGQMITASIILIPLALVLDAPWTLDPGQTALISLALVGLFSTAIPVILMFWLVRNAGATNTSLLAFFMPLASVFLGVAFLGEELPGGALLGLVAILLGAGIVTGTYKRLRPRRRQQA